jgi:hypothetical protein
MARVGAVVGGRATYEAAGHSSGSRSSRRVSATESYEPVERQHDQGPSRLVRSRVS